MECLGWKQAMNIKIHVYPRIYDCFYELMKLEVCGDEDIVQVQYK